MAKEAPKYKEVSRAQREENAKKELTPIEQRKAQMAAEIARQEKESRDIIAHRRIVKQKEDERRKSDAATAAALKPECQYQKEVVVYPTDSTTLQLGQAIRAASEKRQALRWMTISPERARDHLNRAYPLALQMGIMATMEDRNCALRIQNGGRIEFVWPTT